MCIDPLGDHVLTCKQHTGSIRGHDHLIDVVASLSRDSKIGPVRVNHKVSTTGDCTRKQGDVEISNLPISLRDGLVIDVSFVCEFKGSSRAPGGWNNGVRHSNDVIQARANVEDRAPAAGALAGDGRRHGLRGDAHRDTACRARLAYAQGAAARADGRAGGCAGIEAAQV